MRSLPARLAHLLVHAAPDSRHINSQDTVYLDENGQVDSMFDVFDYIKLVREHYEKNGIGVDYIEKLMR